MQTITKVDASNLMRNSNGKIFRVNFTKKDGTDRKMVCRTGVSQYVKGVGLKFDPASKGLLGVYDMAISNGAKGYRFVSLNAVHGLKINGTEYAVAE